MKKKRSYECCVALSLLALLCGSNSSGFTLPTARPLALPHRSSFAWARSLSESPSIIEDSRATPPRRRPLVAGNWKLNPTTLADAVTLLQLLHANVLHHRSSPNDSGASNHHAAADMVVFPPLPFVPVALQLLEGSGIQVGVQNVGLHVSGAFTGEVSASQVRSLGVDCVLLGHSERRLLFDETDAHIQQKIQLCLQEPGLSIILCVGETKEEYDAELLASVCNLQVRKALQGVAALDVAERISIAYEPVWAIGTGVVATPEQAQVAHAVIRQTLTELYGAVVAQQVRIQYGGSVQPTNVAEILRMPDVDGALVGGASLSADSFCRIVDGAVDAAAAAMAHTPRPRELTAQVAVRTKNVLGESAVWSTRDQALYWISAPEQEVWTWNGKDPAYRRLVGTDIGCVALLRDERMTSATTGSIVVAGERAFLRLDMSADSEDDAAGPKTLCDRPEKTDVTRPNDGRVDRQGRLVFGMYNNYHRAPVEVGVGGANICGLYRLTDRCQVESLWPEDGSVPKYRVSNCICFSPGLGETMYFCDTPTRKIYAFDYPTAVGAGKLSHRRLIWTMPSHLSGGPDGAQVDAEGFLWVALSGASRVVRIDPSTGLLDTIVHVPVTCPTSVTLGGPKLDELFITTRGPDGGALYRAKLPNGMQGIAEPEFRVVADNTSENTGT